MTDDPQVKILPHWLEQTPAKQDDVIISSTLKLKLLNSARLHSFVTEVPPEEKRITVYPSFRRNQL